ncbi:hypothetical protein DFH94DRAFT_366627 [Russula ochroleuca]|jgi:hypothetical protein|uniref:Uncharacterized protein n=1 Tax=Russula ochroleuca TaxID=152965 RepID=A0A9P5MZH0_9AGAM|nr:hypothetical protein DFH94DRAFT_366627 [Russula ochroleuca]
MLIMHSLLFLAEASLLDPLASMSCLWRNSGEYPEEFGVTTGGCCGAGRLVGGQGLFCLFWPSCSSGVRVLESDEGHSDVDRKHSRASGPKELGDVLL